MPISQTEGYFENPQYCFQNLCSLPISKTVFAKFLRTPFFKEHLWANASAPIFPVKFHNFPSSYSKEQPSTDASMFFFVFFGRFFSSVKNTKIQYDIQYNIVYIQYIISIIVKVANSNCSRRGGTSLCLNSRKNGTSRKLFTLSSSPDQILTLFKQQTEMKFDDFSIIGVSLKIISFIFNFNQLSFNFILKKRIRLVIFLFFINNIIP